MTPLTPETLKQIVELGKRVPKNDPFASENRDFVEYICAAIDSADVMAKKLIRIAEILQSKMKREAIDAHSDHASIFLNLTGAEARELLKLIGEG